MNDLRKLEAARGVTDYNAPAPDAIIALLDELEELRLAYAECSRQKNELLTKHKQYAEMIHTCGPTCSRAGCVNQRLLDAARGALDALSCSGEPDEPGHRCTHCDDYVDRNNAVRNQLRAALGEQA